MLQQRTTETRWGKRSPPTLLHYVRREAREGDTSKLVHSRTGRKRKSELPISYQLTKRFFSYKFRTEAENFPIRNFSNLGDTYSQKLCCGVLYVRFTIMHDPKSNCFNKKRKATKKYLERNKWHPSPTPAKEAHVLWLRLPCKWSRRVLPHWNSVTL